jgi:hypothetical protein
MVFHCDRCGFHNNYGQAMSPEGRLCPACMVGHMRRGQLPSGFRLADNAIAVFPADGQGITATYQRLAGEQHLPFLDFFANENLNHYKHFIQAETVFLGRFNKYLVPDQVRYAWLSPYKRRARHAAPDVAAVRRR